MQPAGTEGHKRSRIEPRPLPQLLLLDQEVVIAPRVEKGGKTESVGRKYRDTLGREADPYDDLLRLDRDSLPAYPLR